MISATKKWIFLKISGAMLVPLMLWFIANYSRGSSFGEIIAIAKF